VRHVVAVLHAFGGLRSSVNQSISFIGPYPLVRRAGMGAMGRVDLVLRRDATGAPALCVVKRLTADAEPHLKERFQREGRIALSLHHPNIARTFEVTTVEGEPCLVQEFIHGLNLDLLSARLSSAMPVPIACLIVKEVAEALAYAHEHGILHRDVAPPNIMVGFDGAVRLIDFGVAKDLAPPPSERVLTAVGSTVGRKYFAAPELLEGYDATTLTDVFALGVVLWQLLSDRDFPFSGTAIRAIPEAPSRFNDALPPGLDAVSLRAVSFDPATRTPSAAELARQLAPFAASTHPLKSFLMSGAHLDLDRERAALAREVAAAATVLPVAARRKTSFRVLFPLALVAAIGVATAYTFNALWTVSHHSTSSVVPAPVAQPGTSSVDIGDRTASPAPPHAPAPPSVTLPASPEPTNGHRHSHQGAAHRLPVAASPDDRAETAPAPMESPEALIQSAITALKARNYAAAQTAAELAVSRGGGERAEKLLARIKLDRGEQ